jgi:hypothetical protein
MHVPLLITLLYTREFPDFLSTLDGIIILLAIVHLMVIKPLIKNGIIKAYYRKHYRTKASGSFFSVVYTGIWFGVILRSVLLITNFLLQYLSFEKSEIPSLLSGMKMNYMDLYGAIVGLILFSLFMYILYYKDRFISIEEFSNRSMRYVNQYGWNIDKAMEKVLYEQEMRVEHGLVKEVKTDDKDVTLQIEELNIPLRNDGIVPLDNDHLSDCKVLSEIDIVNLTDRNIIIPMRRQARR